MQLHTLVDPVYFPEADQQSVLRLGLQNLSPDKWLLVDEDFAQFLKHKQEQGRVRKDKVFAQTEQSRAAQKEFCRVLADHLTSYWPEQYRIDNDALLHLPSQTSRPVDTHSLWDSSLWIQDDICLLEKSDAGYLLTAASLCSPSNWKLEDKIGKSVDWIHEPVPGYQEQLATRVNKLLSGLKPKKPVLRLNWSVQRGNELCWREDVTGDGGEDYFWRVERQTLLRLPRTGRNCVCHKDFSAQLRHHEPYRRIQFSAPLTGGETIARNKKIQRIERRAAQSFAAIVTFPGIKKGARLWSGTFF